MALRSIVFAGPLWTAHHPVRGVLEGQVWQVTETADERDLLHAARTHGADLVVIGGLPNDDALQLMRDVRRGDHACAVLLFASDTSQQFAVSAFRSGATDLLPDNASAGMIDEALARLAGTSEAATTGAKTTPAEPLIGGAKFVGRSRAVESTREAVRRVAQSDSNVLITGETGTGKELVAEMIHRNSSRVHKPFVCINCAAIPDTLFESELFGYERGAFTGAHATTMGKLEAANGGTVFFDEIGEMTPYAQAKILRTIESKQIQHLGGHRSIALNIRVVSATNRDLDALAMDDHFRKDLYFRINVGRIHLPPLRERKGDIVALIEHFIREFNQSFSAGVSGVESETMERLLDYRWPGNVRELRNVIESIFVSRPAPRITFSDLPEWLRNRLRAIDPTALMTESDRILNALLATNWNKSLAAQKLHWSRMTLYRKLAKYGLDTRVR